MNLNPRIAQAIKTYADTGAYGRSFYLYDLSVMAGKIADLVRLMPENVDIFYAQKANPHTAFLNTARQAGLSGIEIASLGEGRDALKAGFAPNQIIFTGPGKSPEELIWCVETGIRTVHVESFVEAHRLSQICAARGKTQDILVRVNPNFHIHGAQANFSGDSSKMGVDEQVFRARVSEILDIPHLIFRGLHVYAASGVLKVEDLIENCRRVFELAKDIEADDPRAHCNVIDFGGGFGIDYKEEGEGFDIAEYSSQLADLTSQFEFQNRRLILELGRYLTADSGWYCTEILDIKMSLGKHQIVCQGGAHHFRRPVALRINHPSQIVSMNRPKVFEGQESVVNAPAHIGGPLCNSADKLAPHDVHIDKADIGDIFVIGLAGAYGLSMSHVNFLSHDLPSEIILDPS